MLSFITVPSTALADVMSATGTLFADLWVLIAIAIGIPVAFYVIRRTVSFVRGGAR